MLFSFPEHFVQKCVPAISALMALGLPGILSEFREIAYDTKSEEKRCKGGFGFLRLRSVCRHQSEIMFCVLVVVFCPNDIPGSRFLLGECEIFFVAHFRALKPGRGRARSPRIRFIRARVKRPHRSRSPRAHVAILHGFLLGYRQMKCAPCRTHEKSELALMERAPPSLVARSLRKRHHRFLEPINSVVAA